ncbi:MAG TPA: aroma-sacti cluster domain-containing protein [Thermoanaerobaculia bacterium]|nr:aroma-sacti cluster domain-containing protein [Thermoanaerobaculia bacterium]
MANGSNLDRLVEAKCIPDPDLLSASERQVIDELSDQEVETLIGIRKKLGAAATSQGAGFGEPEFQSNIVV